MRRIRKLILIYRRKELKLKKCLERLEIIVFLMGSVNTIVFMILSFNEMKDDKKEFDTYEFVLSNIIKIPTFS